MVEFGWIIAGDGHWAQWMSTPWWTFPNTPVWLCWFVVAVLGMRGARRTAAAGAWLATVGLVMVTMLRPGGYWWLGLTAAWLPLGLLAAVSLTTSPGPARGRELMGRRLPVMVAATVIVTWAVGTLGHHLPGAPLFLLAVQIFGVVTVCRPGTRSGRRAALMLIVVVMTTWLASLTQFSTPIPVIVVRTSIVRFGEASGRRHPWCGNANLPLLRTCGRSPWRGTQPGAVAGDPRSGRSTGTKPLPRMA
jgi:hypothetical protein